MTAFQTLGELTKEAYRSRAMAQGGMDVIETLVNMLKRNPADFGAMRALLKKIPATNATKSTIAPWRTAGQYAGIGGISGGIGAGIGGAVDAIRDKGMFFEDNQATKEAARGDQLLKNLKSLAVAAANNTGQAGAHAATRIDRTLNWPLQRYNADAGKDLAGFIERIRAKGALSGLSPENLAAVSGRNTGKMVPSYFKEYVSEVDPAWINSSKAQSYAKDLIREMGNR